MNRTPHQMSTPLRSRRSSVDIVNSLILEKIRDGESLLEPEEPESSGDDAVPGHGKSRAYPVKAHAAPFPAGVKLAGPASERFATWGIRGFEFVARESLWNRVLRWPILLLIFAIMLIEFAAYLIVRAAVIIYESSGLLWPGRAMELRRAMSEATTYAEFKAAALALDQYLGNDTWRKRIDSLDHDYDAVARTARRLDRYRTRGDLEKLQETLLHGALKPNHGGVENLALYAHTFFGTKDDVERFVASTVAALDYLAASSLPAVQKRAFFRRAAHLYGRSALALSGGAGLGYYHLGVLDALVQSGTLPDIVSGTSAGSLIAAMIGTRTLEEIRRDILTSELHQLLKACSEPWLVRLARWWKTGALFDIEDWYSKLETVIGGNTTFLEAYQKTGRILNVSVVPEEPGAPPKLLNYLTGPDVVVASAVLASSAVPGILNPVELRRKTPSGRIVAFKGAGRRWRDGSLRVDFPEQSLHRMFNVNYSIVSQVNPHVGLFFYERRGAAGVPPAHRGGRGWRGGFVLALIEHTLKLSMIKWATLLRDMNLLPRYVSP